MNDNLASDGLPVPPPCDEEIFRNGHFVAMGDGSSNAIENWVREIAKRANARVDWHYAGGRAIVKMIGDHAALTRCRQAAADLPIIPIS